MTSLVDALSVAIVVPAVGLTMVVLKHWGSRVLRVLSMRQKIQPVDWIILGVTTSFSAFSINSLFWGLHFLAVLMKWDSLATFTYDIGPEVNIFTRNVPYGLAAAFHLVAYKRFLDKKIHLWGYFITAVVTSVLSLVILLVVAP